MLVIARYNEDISWALPHKDNVIVYNKGDINTIHPDLLPSVIELPNIGREAHTFLYYIVHNYDNLPPLIIFSQGTYLDHISQDEFDKLFQVETHSTNFTDGRSWGHHLIDYNCRILAWDAYHTLSRLNETYGAWYERIFETPFPHDDFLVYKGAVFSVSADIIRSYPKSLYEKLLFELSHARSPEEAHFMERTWGKMYRGRRV